MATKKKAAKKEKPEDAPGYLPIDGIAPKRYPALDKQCDDLMAAREKISKARESEKEIHAVLLEMMHEREIKQYKHTGSDKIFSIEDTEKVKYKNLKEENGSEPAPSNAINPGAPMGDVELDEDDDAE